MPRGGIDTVYTPNSNQGGGQFEIALQPGVTSSIHCHNSLKKAQEFVRVSDGSGTKKLAIVNPPYHKYWLLVTSGDVDSPGLAKVSSISPEGSVIHDYRMVIRNDQRVVVKSEEELRNLIFPEGCQLNNPNALQAPEQAELPPQGNNGGDLQPLLYHNALQAPEPFHDSDIDDFEDNNDQLTTFDRETFIANLQGTIDDLNNNVLSNTNYLNDLTSGFVGQLIDMSRTISSLNSM